MNDPRLSTLLKYLKGFNVLIDVGTDHAYLPIEAVKKGFVHCAYAFDNKAGPLAQATKNIDRHQLKQKITTKLSSGIDDLPEDADVLVMAGLGGEIIYKSLANKPLKNLKRLILQPNNAAMNVRKLTEVHRLTIIDETVVKYQGYYYPVIVMEEGQVSLSDKALRFGPILLKKRPLAFIEMLKAEHDYLQGLIDTIPYQEAKKPHIDSLKAIEEVLYERNDH